MKPGFVARALPDLLAVKLFRQRIPIIVSIVVTTRCNYACRYCGCWTKTPVDLDHDRLLALFREMAHCGTKKIIFTGGEPLLREDIHELAVAARSYKLVLSLNTNGSLIEAHQDTIKLFDSVSLSLDGPERIHDSIRESGSFKTLMTAANLIRKWNIPLRFAIVVSRWNSFYLEEILAISRQFNATLSVQPASQHLLFSDSQNPLAPTPERFRLTINQLLRAKRSGYAISNSYQGLLYLRSWPHPEPISCAGGRLFCRIEANGDITICGRSCGKSVAANIYSEPFLTGFRQITTPDCEACWCGLLAELNLSFSLHPSTLMNTILYY